MVKMKYKSANTLRQSCINFSLSETEKKTIAEKAENMGLSMSAYIRYKLFHENKEV